MARVNPWALCVMTKAPLPGQAKSRLAATLGQRAAAELARCLLLDTLRAVAAIPGVDVSLFCPSAAHRDALGVILAEFGQPAVPIRIQATSGLMAGLAECLRVHLDLGYGRVALIDADSPTVPAT